MFFQQKFAVKCKIEFKSNIVQTMTKLFSIHLGDPHFKHNHDP
jgi:hypothetical protein